MAQSKKATNPSRIIGLQFSILSPDEIRKASVANIVTRDTYVNNKPVIGGLFDPRMGVLDPGLICPTDGLNYMQTPGYFGHIELARPIFYIQYLNTILKILRCVCVKCSKLLIDKSKYDYLLKLDSQKRWLKVFKLASKVTRCGDETCNGCGCKQPRKIMKEGLATLIAEWDNMGDSSESNSKEKLTMKMTPEEVLKIFRRISDEDVTFMGFSAVWSRPDWMICQVLAVPPPAVRPSVKHDAQQRSEDDISHIIVNIIKANKTLQEKLQQNASAKVIDDWTMVLQYYCATMVDNKIPGVASVAQRSGRPLKSIKERLVGKPGRVRGNLMGKRVDFSARSVITPDANIGISQLGVPLKIAKNITFPEVVNKRNRKFLMKLVLNGPEVYPGAKILEKKAGDSISLRYVDRESIELNDGDIVHRHLINGDPVLFNRQPTLHRMSMMCHFVKVLKKGDTFRMNVADTKPYNADFDGDEINMHGPQDYESAAELTNLAAVARQIISPANNKPIIGIFQDSLLGAYRFTRPNINFDTRTAMNMLMAIDKVNPIIFKDIDKRVSCFELLTQILPPMSSHFSNGAFDSTEEDSKTSNNIIEIVNGNYLRGQLNKAALGKGSKGLLHSIFNDFSYQDAADFIDNLQAIVTEYMKLSAYSVGISDLIADAETNNKISDAIVKKKIEVKNLIDQTHLGTFENTTGKSNEEEFESKVNSILQKAAEQAGKIGRKSLAADNRFVIMVNAGSKGSGLNIAQMISCLGQQNVDGKRIPYGFEDRTLPHYTKYNDSPEARGFVESSFIQGLTPTELFFHAMGGRTGLIDTAVKTSTTGYIQRRLIKGLEDLRVHYDMTVRNNKNKIIQFAYGDDNIDATKVEAQKLDLVSMTREEVYAHFQMPSDESKDGLLTTNYTKPTIKRIKKQKQQLVEKTEEMVNYMMESRDLIVARVFKYSDGNTVNIPVHFMRIINNIHNQLNIQSNSMVNITPIEFYELIDKSFENLMKNVYAPPSALFKIAYYYYLSPKNILTIKRFNKKALILLLETLTTNYNKAVVHPGEMVGMIAAQSIGEPTTQMTLNTFHFAGVASKSNATRGVPRVEEILSLSENPKKPSVTIHLKQDERDNIEKAQELKYSLEYTSLRDVVESVSICFDPDNLQTLIEEDQPLLAEYNAFQNMVAECQGDDFEQSDDVEMSKWIVRMELDKESMLDKHISTDDIHFALSNSYGDDINCVYADMNADKLVFRVRLSQSNTSSKTKSLDQSDEIYKLKNFQNNLLDNIILRGVKKIPKVLLRKIVDEVIEEDGNYTQKDGWVLDTVGTNLKDILTLPNINSNKTFSNDIQEVYRTLGIEAARQAIFNELSEAMDHAGVYINYHHLSMLCDRMTATQNMVSIFRHGINNDDIGPIAKASFEETPEMFLKAARHAELDVMTGVSANIMCGQEGYFGTGSFQVMLDVNKMGKLGEKKLEKKTDISVLMTAENPDDKCSDQNIQISSTTEFVNNVDTGDVNDDYDIGF